MSPTLSCLNGPPVGPLSTALDRRHVALQPCGGAVFAQVEAFDESLLQTYRFTRIHAIVPRVETIA